MFLRDFKVRDKWIGEQHQPYIIAEMACAHDGNVEKAKKLIDSAVEAGVDAIQLQLFSAQYLMVPHHHLWDLIQQLEFSRVEWLEIYNYARQFDIAVFAFAYDQVSLEFAIHLRVDGIKLNSSDLSNPDLLSGAVKSGLPITLGTGASTFTEIGEAISIVKQNHGSKLVLMHGVQQFPTPINNANIERLKMLKDTFQLPTGYQDHTDADLNFAKIIDLMAIGAGASIIEKHITVDRKEKGTDYQAALEPQELKEFVTNMRFASEAMGERTILEFSESEMNYRKFQKKSIVALHDLEEGDIIDEKSMGYMRTPENGLPPSYGKKILGKSVIKAVKKYENILLDNVE